MRIEEIVDQWREEVKALTFNDEAMHESQIKHVLDDLEYYALESNTELSINSVDGVWKSDSFLSDEIHQKLIHQLVVLE